MTQPEKIKIIADKIKGIKTATLVTLDKHGHIHGRPMATQDIEFDGNIWFMTSKDSRKIAAIERNPQVGLMYSEGVTHVSVAGTAMLSNDREKIKGFWNDLYKAWFTDENDPSIILIKVEVQGAEYWDHAGGKIGAYIDMAQAAITGDHSDTGENEALKL